MQTGPDGPHASLALLHEGDRAGGMPLCAPSLLAMHVHIRACGAHAPPAAVQTFVDLRQTPVLCKADLRNSSRRVRTLWFRCRCYFEHRVRRGPNPLLGPDVNRAMRCARCSYASRSSYGTKAEVYHVDVIPTPVGLRVM